MPRALEAERQLAAARLRALAAEHDAIVTAAEGANGDDEHDPEGATVAYERARAGALVGSALGHLQEVDRALDRVRAGTYGSCERCGLRIGDARLAARPAARWCISCATASGGNGHEPGDRPARSG